MTATLNRTRQQATANGHAPPVRSQPKTTRINRTRAVLGALITTLSIVAVLTLYSHADNRTQVLALAHRVPAGQVVTSADLTTVEVPASSTLATVTADKAGTVVGQVALSTLEAGTLLAPNTVAKQPLVPAGSAIVGAVLKPGQYPVGLRTGDTVRVVESPVATSAQNAGPIDRGIARIVDLSTPGAANSEVTVSLLVASDTSVALSSAGASGRISLVVIGS